MANHGGNNKNIAQRKTEHRIILSAATFFVSQMLAPSAFAQGAASPAGDDKPIDIQANEQEFVGDEVIAKGNVKVTYRDSVVRGPSAHLYRTPDGQPKKAVFTGHPRLVQLRNKIDADTLIFEIDTGLVTADGHAHSEVTSQDDSPPDDDKDAKDTKKDKDGKLAKGKDAKGADKTKVADADDEIVDSATAAAEKEERANGGKKGKGKEIKASHAQTPEMIITDSDHQEYIKDGGKFEATGNVHVKTGDIVVHSNHLQLVYGTDSKPETAIFTGGVDATQFENNTKSDAMTYFLATQRLQATGNVKSKVIQKKTDDAKKGGPSGPSTTTNDGEIDAAALGDIPDDNVIDLNSDAQDFSKDTGRISASGNVHLKYGEISGYGPNVVVLRNDEGLAEKVIFSGRSQINQPGKRWIGDRITFTVTDKKVLAEGNTRALIINGKKAAPTASVAAAKVTPAAPNSSAPKANEQLAKSGNSSVASSKPASKDGVPQ